MAANYFTCTLGQAASLGKIQHDFNNITEFVDLQAKRVPKKPAVAFPIPSTGNSKAWDKAVFAFEQLRRGSHNVAKLIWAKQYDGLGAGKTTALICPSTPEFLFMWLALMRLGHAVLLIAPQCQPSAIAHLCKACEVSTLFYDEVYQDQALAAAKVMSTEHGVVLHAVVLPFHEQQDLNHVINQELVDDLPVASVKEDDMAYLHHTSGTSSGAPKPIPQSHRAGAGVLPSFSDGHERAAFTTTPLYHGGVADSFRAWTSNALIWLFPGKGVPITASNIVKSLEVAHNATSREGLPPVKYFSSVPYVLQMMEADEKGLHYLQSMDIVGVGGAALPEEVGNGLVERGVHLISRFGSAECGFLMSSHRDYETDKEWQYLRSDSGSDRLRFEEQGDGLAELVILQGWPHMAKTNREDGSFATADLFAAHPTIPNAWKYHSRADSQLTLITGKKFDPAPLEGAIAASPLLEDVIIFGNGQPFPGALLFRSEKAKDIADTDLVDQLWSNIEKLNADSQDHARLSRRMLVPMSVLQKPLEKSSKGTVLRGVTEKRFKDVIDGVYSKETAGTATDVPDNEVARFVKQIVLDVMRNRTQLNDDTDLYSYGVDSVAGMQIRYGLRQTMWDFMAHVNDLLFTQLLPSDSNALPLNVVDDCATIERLAEYIISRRHGRNIRQNEDEENSMVELVELYSRFRQDSVPPHNSEDGNAHGADGDVVVLTGATGALGAHILDIYRTDVTVSRIYCLVRGADHHAATERVNKALEQRHLESLHPTGDPTSPSKVEVLKAQLSEPNLGLSEEVYQMLAQQATIIMHVAWSVNFRMRLRSFVKDSIAGVTNLINLALSSSNHTPPKFAFCSSVASAICRPSPTIPERILSSPSAASPLGYSRSKWVAEHVCANASQATRLARSIGVFRVGQLAGDSKTGIWNSKEAWPMMLSTVKLTHSLPELEDQPLDWLPVDVAARAMVQGAAVLGRDGDDEALKVFHVVNEHREPKWTDLLQWLGKREQFEIVIPKAWVERLEAAQETEAEHPAYKLLDHWKRAFADESGETGGAGEEGTGKVFEMHVTKRVIPVLRDVRPVDEVYFGKIWEWLQKEM
ncbi:hypothetical protein LTR66_006215 [Elasticomyces elasticus]|nr:hypothetical protein LTR66_006215 [Elasticomyces elasticus]